MIILNEALVELISKSFLFEGLRLNLINHRYSVLMILGTIISCPYCCSFWTAFALNALFNVSLNLELVANGYVNFFINYFIVCILVQRVSNYLHGFSDRHFNTVKDVRYQA
jgi:hypothetical protein